MERRGAKEDLKAGKSQESARDAATIDHGDSLRTTVDIYVGAGVGAFQCRLDDRW
jgi:hypothetical protein